MNIKEAKFYNFILIICIHTLAILSDILIFSPKNETIDAFNDIPAEFGSPIPLNGISGYVVHAHPAKACSPIYPPPINMSIHTPWFVLIERNGCDFDYKVLNAQRAGYSVAIVYNFESDSLIPMHGYRFVKEIEIPSVFIGWSAAIRILKSYTYYSGNYLKVTEDLPFNLNNYLLPFAIVIAICFLIMLVFIICKFIRERRYRMRNRLTARNLKSIPVKKYQAGDTTDVCAVCLEDYVEGDKLRILPCSHAYHSKCVDPWLTKSKRSCPVCKRKIVFGKRRQRTQSSRLPPKCPPNRSSSSAPRIGPEPGSDPGTFLRFLFPDRAGSGSSLVTIVDVRSENEVTEDDSDEEEIVGDRRLFQNGSGSTPIIYYDSSSANEEEGEEDPVELVPENRALLRCSEGTSYGAIPSRPETVLSAPRTNLSERINNFLFGRLNRSPLITEVANDVTHDTSPLITTPTMAGASSPSTEPQRVSPTLREIVSASPSTSN